MKSFVLCLLVVQATIHFVSSKLEENDLLSDKICHNVDHLDVEIAGSGLTCGGEVRYKVLNSAADNPMFQYHKADKDKLYTIFVVDADEPGCKTKLHYMIGNVPGEKLAKGDNSVKDVVSVYFPPELPHGSSEHRYFIYAFSQTIPIADLAIPSARCDFKLGQFIDDDSLKLVAANMLKTQNK